MQVLGRMFPVERRAAKAYKAPVRNWLRNLVAASIGLAIGLVLIEVSLIWIVPPPLHYRYPQTLHVVDHELGWVMRPNQHAFTIAWPVVTNGLGLRSPEIAAVKRPGTIRVLCLGDSNTFGIGVAQEENYAARLQALLRGQGRAEAEVINAGVGGYDTLQEVDLMERLTPTMKPDVAVIGFFINDIGESLRINKDRVIDPATGESWRLGLKRLTPYRLIYLLKRSRLVTLVYWRWGILMAGKNPDNEILEGRTPLPYEEAWKRIEDTLRRARRDAISGGYRLIVFPVPTGQEFMSTFPREQYRSRLASLAKTLGVEFLDPTPVMKAAGGGFDTYFVTWDGHINQRTHNIIARLLADKIGSGAAGEAVTPTASRRPLR